MSETQATATPRKPATVYTPVEFIDADGTTRTVQFPGKTRMMKSTSATAEDVTLRIDFVNGESRSVTIPRASQTFTDCAEHGLSQKVGDEASGEKEVDDMVVCIEAIMDRLAKGEWGRERAAGDSFAGASVVIRAIVEASGKTVAEVKAYLEKRLADGKEGGLTRAKLYNAFRNPETKTGQIILRLEKERAKKDAAPIDVDGELAGIGA